MENKKSSKSGENCCRCGKYAKTEDVGYCRQCLCAVIEKRVKRKLAGARGSRRNHKPAKLAVLCDDKGSLRCVAAAYLVKKMSRPGFGVEIITPESSLQLQERRENAVVVLPKCADDIAAGFMEKFIRPKTDLKSPQHPLPRKISVINIFEAVTERELAIYADIKSLKYAKTEGSAEENGLKQRIQKFQARYPGTIEALVRSGRRIEGFLE